MHIAPEVLKVLGIDEDDTSKKERAEIEKFVFRVNEMSGNEIDTLIALYRRGPLEDGDIPSKVGLESLMEKEWASKIIVRGWDGYNACSYKGSDAYKVYMAIRL